MKYFKVVIDLCESDKKVVIAKINEVKGFNWLPKCLEFVFIEMVT